MPLLPRLHLFELEDLAWFPRIVRDYGTDYLQFIQERFGMHGPMVPILERALRRSEVRRIVDLGSGGGGPILGIHADFCESGEPVAITLTDRYPNEQALARIARLSGGGIDWVKSSVDARSVPGELRGVRTMFNSFHHFAPADARRILADAVGAGVPIAVLEIPNRALVYVLSMVLTPFMVLAATPLIRPFRWRRLLLTYLWPAVPLLCFWDGLVSQLRAYTAPELDSLARSVEPDRYHWKSGTVSMGPARLTYLVGYMRAISHKP